MYLDAIVALHDLQMGRIRGIDRKTSQNLHLGDEPPTRSDGLYWLYTSYDWDSLVECTPNNQQRAVNIPLIAAAHRRLNARCAIEVNGFRLVYNGIGGRGPKGKGGLRERIGSEFTGGDGTGSLGILKTSLSDISKWRFSFVLWEEILLNPPSAYSKANATLIERDWRLHYGWPILCSN